MSAKKHNCEACPMRAKYDKKPKSLLGRVWRWHINFCPGWKKFINSISETQKKEYILKYNLNK